MDFNNDRPIYLQIVEMIQFDIISGTYKANEKLPSVRELSSFYRVNPNTLQRAFVDLEGAGLVYTERTNGRFVTNDITKIEQLRKDVIKTAVGKFLDDMKNLNVQDDELITLVKHIREGEIT